MKALVYFVFLFLVFLCNVESFTYHFRKGSLPPKSWIAASKLHAKEVRKSNGGEHWEQGSNNNNKKQKKTSRSSLKLKSPSRRLKKAKHHGERKYISLGTDDFDEIKQCSSRNGWRKVMKLVFFFVQGDLGKAQICPC
jgi:hypothetical protein